LLHGAGQSPEYIITQFDNILGGLPDFLSTNPQEVKMFLVTFKVLENQENVKIGK
jgi:hypothetical protein